MMKTCTALLAIVLLSSCARTIIIGKTDSDHEVRTYRASVESPRIIISTEDLRKYDYVQYAADWEVTIKLTAVRDRNGWHAVSPNVRLLAAIRDAPGIFNVYENEPLPKKTTLMVIREKKTGKVTAIYVVPDDL